MYMPAEFRIAPGVADLISLIPRKDAKTVACFCIPEAGGFECPFDPGELTGGKPPIICSRACFPVRFTGIAADGSKMLPNVWKN